MIPLILFLALQQPQEPHITPESASHYPMLHVACNNGDQAPLLDADKKQMGWIYCDGHNAVFVLCGAICAREEKFTSDNLILGPPRKVGVPEYMASWLEAQHLEWLEKTAPPQITAICGEQMQCMHGDYPSGHSASTIEHKKRKMKAPSH